MSDPSAAEFEKDRRALNDAMSKIEGWDGSADNRDSEAGLAAGELLRTFYIKYRVRLEAAGIDVTEFLLDLDEKRRVMEEALKVEDKALDDHLQATAESAEAQASLIEAEYRVFRSYENMTEADWAAQTPAEQAEMRDLIDRLRESMPEMLASLPMEKRRELEGLG